VKFLLDENLPRGLAGSLEKDFPGTLHVASLDMLSADDGAIWDYCRDNGFAILSKDRDFADRVVMEGPPPKVVWLRVGNCSASSLLSILHGASDAIQEFMGSRDAGLLVFPPGLSSRR